MILRTLKPGFLNFLLLASVFAASPPGSAPNPPNHRAEATTPVAKKTDSLETLHLLLSSEMKPQNRIWVLKSGKLVDSLAHGAGMLRRENWDRVIQDSGIAVEMKSQADFQAYWKQIERREGIPELKGQLQSQDVVKSRIPKLILFDSTLIVYPGWIVLLKR